MLEPAMAIVGVTLVGGAPRIERGVRAALARRIGLKFEAIRALPPAGAHDQRLGPVAGYELLMLHPGLRRGAGEQWMAWLAETWSQVLPRELPETGIILTGRYGLAINLDTAEILNRRTYATLQHQLERAHKTDRRTPLTIEWTERAPANRHQRRGLSDKEALSLAGKRLAQLMPYIGYIAIDDMACRMRCYTALARLAVLLEAGVLAERIVLKFDRSILAQPALIAHARGLAEAHAGPCVLEGVESKAGLAAARAIGVEWVQGFAVNHHEGGSGL